MKQLLYDLRIAGSLLIICMTVALLLSAVHIATRDVISENERLEKEAAITAIYPAFSTIEETAGSYPDGIQTVYTVRHAEDLLGYAVNLEIKGFGGTIQMMVGIDAAGAVCGVKILSHSETPGLGSRATTDDYLTQYIGLDEQPILGTHIDAVSGATISSRAVKNGVALALSLGLGGIDA